MIYENKRKVHSPEFKARVGIVPSAITNSGKENWKH